MDPKTSTCKFCGKEFPYYAMAKSAMDVGKEPAHCGSRECTANHRYQEKTRNMQTGEYKSPDKIRKI